MCISPPLTQLFLSLPGGSVKVDKTLDFTCDSAKIADFRFLPSKANLLACLARRSPRFRQRSSDCNHFILGREISFAAKSYAPSLPRSTLLKSRVGKLWLRLDERNYFRILIWLVPTNLEAFFTLIKSHSNLLCLARLANSSSFWSPKNRILHLR